MAAAQRRKQQLGQERDIRRDKGGQPVRQQHARRPQVPLDDATKDKEGQHVAQKMRWAAMCKYVQNERQIVSGAQVSRMQSKEVQQLARSEKPLARATTSAVKTAKLSTIKAVVMRAAVAKVARRSSGRRPSTQRARPTSSPSNHSGARRRSPSSPRAAPAHR